MTTATLTAAMMTVDLVTTADAAAIPMLTACCDASTVHAAGPLPILVATWCSDVCGSFHGYMPISVLVIMVMASSWS